MRPGTIYAFEDFQVDIQQHRLTRAGAFLPVSDRHLTVLIHLLAHAGAIVSKDALVAAAWGDVAVTDNSLEQAISALRRVLGPPANVKSFVETVPRQGYRFAAEVNRVTSRETDETLDQLLAPHRAWLEGRAALETLNRDAVVHAREVFAHVLTDLPDMPSAHVGLANACVMQFEMTRVELVADTVSLRLAVHHAQEACRLDSSYGEAWATLGFVLARVERQVDALAALRRAVTLEPDNWRHHLRLSSIAWGEERLRAARRTLSLLPGSPLAHWLAATVYVARQALDEAERELQSGLANEGHTDSLERFEGVALHWLLGLIRLRRGDDAGALVAFERELGLEPRGHLYGRECCANTWYAIGVQHLRHGRLTDAAHAFKASLKRVPRHPMARTGLAMAGLLVAHPETSTEDAPRPERQVVEGVMAVAAEHVFRAAPAEAAHLLDVALTVAPPGSAGWLLPLEPLLRVHEAPGIWTAPLARLRARAV